MKNLQKYQIKFKIPKNKNSKIKKFNNFNQRNIDSIVQINIKLIENEINIIKQKIKFWIF